MTPTTDVAVGKAVALRCRGGGADRAPGPLVPPAPPQPQRGRGGDDLPRLPRGRASRGPDLDPRSHAPEPAPAPEAPERGELPRDRRVRPGRLQPGRPRKPRLAPRRRRHHAHHLGRGDLHRTHRGLLPAPRPGRHALHGRADGLPRDHPGHRLHGRAGPRRLERHPGAVARLPAADGPPGPEHRAEPPGARLRRGGPGARAARSVGRRPAHPAELSRAAPRPGDVHLRVRRPGGGDPGVPGRGRAAVRPLLGQRHREREERDPRGVLGQPLPRHHLDSGRPQPEPPGRRPS